MKPDSPGLHPIANTDSPDRAADIVFVHGLAGGCHTTWTHGRDGQPGHFFWPGELAKELPQCGIWVFGYHAGISRLGPPGMAISQRAGNLAAQLSNNQVGGRPLVFITHSMGGLIVKSLLCDRPPGDHEELIARVRGVAFCSTPHRGSDFASAVSILGRYLGIFGIQGHVREMNRDSLALDDLHERFRGWHRQHPISIQSYAENIGLFRPRWWFRPLPLGLVVSRTSANIGIGDTVIDVDADHIGIVKPSRSNKPVYDTVYRGILRFIIKVLEHPESTRPLPVAQPSGLSQLSDSAVHMLFDALAAEVAMRQINPFHPPESQNP